MDLADIFLLGICQVHIPVLMEIIKFTKSLGLDRGVDEQKDGAFWASG